MNFFKLKNTQQDLLVRVTQGTDIRYRIDSKLSDGSWAAPSDFEAKSLAQVAHHLEALIRLENWDENSQALILQWQKGEPTATATREPLSYYRG